MFEKGKKNYQVWEDGRLKRKFLTEVLMSPDDVCEKYSSKGIKLNIENRDNFILIEGDSITLEFLRNLLMTNSQKHVLSS
jgi:hypothetical protein